MQTIDVKGKKCPEPLIIVKRAIKSAASDETFTVISDNEQATCNLEGMLTEMKIKFFCTRGEKENTLTFSLDGREVVVSEEEPTCPVPEKREGYVVVISSDQMGGNAELGKMLMRGYVNSLSQQDRLPAKIVLYNSGVLITDKDSDTVHALKEMSDEGVDIILCGVCVDFFEFKEKMGVGRISNMMEIATVTSNAPHVVYP